jgi:aspartate racemase
MSLEAAPLKFGLLVVLSVGAGVFYYRTLVKAHLARGISLSILMVDAAVRCVMSHVAARETRERAAYLAELLRQLSAGGAQIGTIPAFAPQLCAQELAELTPIS